MNARHYGPYALLFCCLCASPVLGQDTDDLMGRLAEGRLVETIRTETEPANLIVDMTRTKVGRDFYESFYQQWGIATTAASADSTRRLAGSRLPVAYTLSDYVITLEDLPLPGNGFTSSVSILIDDQLIWQQIIPARRDTIDDYATYAVLVVQAYFADLQSVQNQLDSDAGLN